MGFSEIVRKSSADYRMNPVLFVPPLVALLVSVLTSGILPKAGAQGLPITLPTLAMVGFGVAFLSLVVSFLVILGQASMSGKAVSQGKTKLVDWSSGVKKYFFRVLGISLIFLGIFLLLFAIVGVAYALTILPKLITPQGVVTPSSTMAATFTAKWTATLSLAMALPITVAQSVFYVWLAPAILDDKGVGTSLDLGVKAVRKSWRAFLAFIVLFFVVSVIVALVNDLPAVIGIGAQPLVGSLTSTSILSQIIEKVFSPLWFLIAFELYHESKT